MSDFQKRFRVRRKHCSGTVGSTYDVTQKTESRETEKYPIEKHDGAPNVTYPRLSWTDEVISTFVSIRFTYPSNPSTTNELD